MVSRPRSGYAQFLAGLGQQPTARIKRRPAPSRGWNALDPLHSMKPDDAVILDNIYPDTSRCTLRNGYESFCTGLGGAVESLMPYSSGTTARFLAAANGNLWEISTGTAVSKLAGTTNNRWQSAQYRGYTIMVNGDDNPRKYDGTTVSLNTITGSGLTESNLIHVNVFKSRVFFIEKGTLSYWYLPVDTIAGAASEVDLSSIFREGGTLAAMGTWTRDGGNGLDDVAVFVTTKGEVAIFQGSDPGNVADWSIVGVFRIGEPIGRRCMLNFGPDLIIITKEGAQSCTKQLSYDRANSTATALSARIGNAFNRSALLYSGVFGWEAIHYPRGQYIAFNVPFSTTESWQYVVNTLTGAWCRFTGQDAHCWALFNEEIYFGSNSGVVYKADSGDSDNGKDISYDMLTSYQDDGIGNRKTYDQLRLYLSISANIQPYVGINVDYQMVNPTGQPTLPSTGAYLWDSTFIWDFTPWSADSYPVEGWTGLAGIATVAAIRMQGQCQATFSVNDFGLTFRTGGFM